MHSTWRLCITILSSNFRKCSFSLSYSTTVFLVLWLSCFFDYIIVIFLFHLDLLQQEISFLKFLNYSQLDWFNRNVLLKEFVSRWNLEWFIESFTYFDNTIFEVNTSVFRKVQICLFPLKKIYWYTRYFLETVLIECQMWLNELIISFYWAFRQPTFQDKEYIFDF